MIMPRSLTCSLGEYLNHHMISWLLQILFPLLFHFAKVRTFWHWTSYYLHLPICTAYVNTFAASVCPYHILFPEGFEYYQQSKIMLSRLFHYLYQIYVSGIGGAPTLSLGAGKPPLSWASLDVVIWTATHCCLFDRKLCIRTPTNFYIDMQFIDM